ncbi:U4/U6.U5 tri-snRNP-associated protein 1-like, partial [Cryptotermes secundus]|uniref:U4/U6.U5 tri-snRNP-associated protein 1-like n=1 Tax=Cryptotermes secundus TaxID=105785 RepID=UPI001454DE42
MMVQTGRSKQARLIKEFNIQHCFIFFRDDGKFGCRERYGGPTSDFRVNEGYKPNVKLNYIDNDGHVLNAKEAFGYLSHEFHGKGPGKNKVEKQRKKTELEG